MLRTPRSYVFPRPTFHLLETPYGIVGALVEDRGVHLRLPVLRLEVGRRRVRRVDTTVGGRRVSLPVPATLDPWVATALGVLVLGVLCATVVTLVRRRRQKESTRGDASFQGS